MKKILLRNERKIHSAIHLRPISTMNVRSVRALYLYLECQSLIEELSASHLTDLQQRAYELQATIGLDAQSIENIMHADASCEHIEDRREGLPLNPESSGGVSVISRGCSWLGVGVLLNGMFGSVGGTCASVENDGRLALTRVGSKRVIQISVGFMIFFSIFETGAVGGADGGGWVGGF